jgi:hypothetical protein
MTDESPRTASRQDSYRAARQRSGPYRVAASCSGSSCAADDRLVALRLARYCARTPLALDGPTAGTAALDPLESLSRVR